MQVRDSAIFVSFADREIVHLSQRGPSENSDKLALTQARYKVKEAPSGLKYSDLVCEDFLAFR